MLFELPVMREGVLIPHEDVVAQLNDETISFESGIGFDGARFSPGSYAQVITIGKCVLLTWRCVSACEYVCVCVAQLNDETISFESNSNLIYIFDNWLGPLV